MKIHEMTVATEEIITCDGYLNFCKERGICYIKTDFFYFGPINWRGSAHPSKIEDICVIGHSDYPVTDAITRNFKKSFCINKQGTNPNSFGIPLGITNDCDDSPIHRIYGNKEIMVEVMEMQIFKENLAYMNFNISNYPIERQLVHDLFSNEKWTKNGIIDNTIEGRKRFLMDIKSSKFVFCPRGNGVETTRMWEALYMGSIPIVKIDRAHELFTDLPILFIDDWRKVNERFLIDKYEEMKNREYNMEKLNLSYWTGFIEKKISEK